jgi:hypothetical protein
MGRPVVPANRGPDAHMRRLFSFTPGQLDILRPQDLSWGDQTILAESSMAAGVLRSFEPDDGVIHVLLIEGLSETALRVCGSDKLTAARLPRGEAIQFQLVRDRQGRACAIDVSLI